MSKKGTPKTKQTAVCRSSAKPAPEGALTDEGQEARNRHQDGSAVQFPAAVLGGGRAAVAECRRRTMASTGGRCALLPGHDGPCVTREVAAVAAEFDATEAGEPVEVLAAAQDAAGSPCPGPAVARGGCALFEGHDGEHVSVQPAGDTAPSLHVVVLCALNVVIDTARARRLIVAEFLAGALAAAERVMVIGDGAPDLLLALAEGIGRVAGRAQPTAERRACDVVGRGLRALSWLVNEHEAEGRLHFPFLAEAGPELVQQTVSRAVAEVFSAAEGRAA